MREQRMAMVQSVKQYEFLYRATLMAVDQVKKNNWSFVAIDTTDWFTSSPQYVRGAEDTCAETPAMTATVDTDENVMKKVTQHTASSPTPRSYPSPTAGTFDRDYQEVRGFG